MKTLKRFLLISSIMIITGLLFLFIKHPYLIKALRYRIPGIETAKIFPQNIVQPSNTPFHFIRATIQRNDLDTILVQNSSHQLVPFSDYLKGIRAKIFIVIRNDSIIYEKYADHYTESSLVGPLSVSKSMLSVMLATALQDGSITSLNDKITKYIPELKENQAFSDITVKHLLMMQSGLKYKDLGKSIPSMILTDETKYYYTYDVKKELRQLQRDTLPGTKWHYKAIDPLLLGWALEAATGKNIAAYFEQKVWQPIGSEYAASWGLDHENGLANTASKFQTTAIDLAKIIRLYLNKGNYNGLQILSENWVMQSISIGNTPPLSSKYWQQSTHNYLWWLPQQGTKGDFAAEGMGGQIAYADPKTNTIIIQFADRGKPDYPYRKVSHYLAGIPFEYPKHISK